MRWSTGGCVRRSCGVRGVRAMSVAFFARRSMEKVIQTDRFLNWDRASSVLQPLCGATDLSCHSKLSVSPPNPRLAAPAHRCPLFHTE